MGSTVELRVTVVALLPCRQSDIEPPGQVDEISPKESQNLASNGLQIHIETFSGAVHWPLVAAAEPNDGSTTGEAGHGLPACTAPNMEGCRPSSSDAGTPPGGPQPSQPVGESSGMCFPSQAGNSRDCGTALRWEAREVMLVDAAAVRSMSLRHMAIHVLVSSGSSPPPGDGMVPRTPDSEGACRLIVDCAGFLVRDHSASRKWPQKGFPVPVALSRLGVSEIAIQVECWTPAAHRPLPLKRKASPPQRKLAPLQCQPHPWASRYRRDRPCFPNPVPSLQKPLGASSSPSSSPLSRLGTFRTRQHHQARLTPTLRRLM
eukprot:jgi/Botrbrau1/6656/Bobra.0202s0004.1